MHAVDGVSFTVRTGQTVGVVGESGCGKSVTALSVMRLLATPPAHIEGSVRLRGVELLRMSEREMRQFRGNRISMVFQEAMTSLNPVLDVERQIVETVLAHERVGRMQARRRALDLLCMVRIPSAEDCLGKYPHELSGGMRQRVTIAIAMACKPEVLIADEPTTALDATIQAQVLSLIRRLQRDCGMGVLMITHNFGVVAESCDRVVVMYCGRKVEEADVLDLFDRPMHPYTRALMAALPMADTRAARLAEIPGRMPHPQAPRRGCLFADRCAHADIRCRAETPLLREQGHGHSVACFAVEDHRIPTTSASAS